MQQDSFTLIANAGKIVFNPERDARTFLPNRPAYTSSKWYADIVRTREQVYMNPLNGKFTSKEFEDAIKFAEQLPLEGLMKSNLYRYFLAIPKGLAQVAKTVLVHLHTCVTLQVP